MNEKIQNLYKINCDTFDFIYHHNLIDDDCFLLLRWAKVPGQAHNRQGQRVVLIFPETLLHRTEREFLVLLERKLILHVGK